ncbi:hypothetical protein BLNAU_8330 [Blattamonas nauphoetae]|uniref:Uncharacterized protein n=1 Tax=Blattamonas nauphoetae TaxID=2049346 RepID=A0ABQ9XYZ1_9EUKA|nr:hypothetical protein BLNAU_8330 [Blattamonas nauphoetae]
MNSAPEDWKAKESDIILYLKDHQDTLPEFMRYIWCLPVEPVLRILSSQQTSSFVDDSDTQERLLSFVQQSLTIILHHYVTHYGIEFGYKARNRFFDRLVEESNRDSLCRCFIDYIESRLSDISSPSQSPISTPQFASEHDQLSMIHPTIPIILLISLTDNEELSGKAKSLLRRTTPLSEQEVSVLSQSLAPEDLVTDLVSMLKYNSSCFRMEPVCYPQVNTFLEKVSPLVTEYKSDEVIQTPSAILLKLMDFLNSKGPSQQTSPKSRPRFSFYDDIGSRRSDLEPSTFMMLTLFTRIMKDLEETSQESFISAFLDLINKFSQSDQIRRTISTSILRLPLIHERGLYWLASSINTFCELSSSHSFQIEFLKDCICSGEQPLSMNSLIVLSQSYNINTSSLLWEGIYLNRSMVVSTSHLSIITNHVYTLPYSELSPIQISELLSKLVGYEATLPPISSYPVKNTQEYRSRMLSRFDVLNLLVAMFSNLDPSSSDDNAIETLQQICNKRRRRVQYHYYADESQSSSDGDYEISEYSDASHSADFTEDSPFVAPTSYPEDLCRTLRGVGSQIMGRVTELTKQMIERASWGGGSEMPLLLFNQDSRLLRSLLALCECVVPLVSPNDFTRFIDPLIPLAEIADKYLFRQVRSIIHTISNRAGVPLFLEQFHFTVKPAPPGPHTPIPFPIQTRHILFRPPPPTVSYDYDDDGRVASMRFQSHAPDLRDFTMYATTTITPGGRFQRSGPAVVLRDIPSIDELIEMKRQFKESVDKETRTIPFVKYLVLRGVQQEGFTSSSVAAILRVEDAETKATLIGILMERMVAHKKWNVERIASNMIQFQSFPSRMACVLLPLSRLLRQSRGCNPAGTFFTNPDMCEGDEVENSTAFHGEQTRIEGIERIVNWMLNVPRPSELHVPILNSLSSLLASEFVASIIEFPDLHRFVQLNQTFTTRQLAVDLTTTNPDRQSLWRTNLIEEGMEDLHLFINDRMNVAAWRFRRESPPRHAVVQRVIGNYFATANPEQYAPLRLHGRRDRPY